MAEDKLFYIGSFGETIEHSESEDLIKEAELFSTGVHRGVEYTEEDLDELVKNFKAEDEIPIQIDHSTSAKDTVGYLESVKRKGGKLMGQVRIIDNFAKERIGKKLMSKLSSSFYLKLSEDGFKPYKLREVSLVAFPQVKSARLFSENGYMSEYEENTGGANVTDKNQETHVDLKEVETKVRKEVEQEMKADFEELKKRLSTLEEVEKQFNETQVETKVEKFQADSKIVPAQGDSLKKLLSSFSEEQMTMFEEFMSNSKSIDFQEQGEIDGEGNNENDTRSKEQKEFEEFYEDYSKKFGTSL